MAESSFKLNIKTSADVGGISQAQQALGGLKAEAEELPKKFDDIVGPEAAAEWEALKKRMAEVGDEAKKVGDEAEDAGAKADQGTGVTAAGFLRAAKAAGALGSALTGVAALIKAWGSQNQAAVTAVEGAWEALKQAAAETVGSIVGGGDKVEDWANRVRALVGGMSDEMKSWGFTEEQLAKKREEVWEKNTEALKQELEKQKAAWDDYRQAVAEESAFKSEEAKRNEELAAADDEVERAKIDASGMTPEEKAAAKQGIDENARARRSAAAEDEQRRAVEAADNEAEIAAQQAEQVAATAAEQEAKVRNLKRAEAERNLAAGAQEESRNAQKDIDQADFDQATWGPLAKWGLGRDPKEQRAAAQARKAKADADAERFGARAAESQRAAGTVSGTMEQEQGRLKDLQEQQAEREKAAAEAAERAGKEGEKFDGSISHKRALEAREEQARKIRQGGGATPPPAADPGKLDAAADAATVAAADVGKSAEKLATTTADSSQQIAGDMRQMAGDLDRSLSAIQAAVAANSQAIMAISQRTEQVAQAAAAALNATADLRNGNRPYNR